MGEPKWNPGMGGAPGAEDYEPEPPPPASPSGALVARPVLSEALGAEPLIGGGGFLQRPAGMPQVVLSPDLAAKGFDPSLGRHSGVASSYDTNAPFARPVDPVAALNAARASEGLAPRSMAAAGQLADPYAGIPEELRPQFGGNYYPPGYKGLVDERIARSLTDALEGKPQKGDITTKQADKLRADYTKFRNSPLGLQQQIEESQLAGAGERSQLAQGALGIEQGGIDRAAAERARADAAAAQFDAQQERIRQEHARELERRGAQIEEMNRDLASTKVDPERYWSSKDGGAKMLSTIGLMLGGFVNGYSRGQVKNSALEMMNAQIERDIDAQKAELSNKRAAVEGQRTLYGMARERFNDDAMAANYTRSRLYEQAERAAQGIAAGAKSQLLQNQAKLLSQQYGEQARNFELQTKLRAAELAAQQAMARAGGGAGSAAAKSASPGDQARMVQYTLADGRIVTAMAGSEKIAKEINSKNAGRSRLVQALEKVQEQNEGFIMPLLSRGHRGEADAAVHQARTAWLESRGLKPSQKNWDLAVDAVPDVPAAFDAGEKAKWKSELDAANAENLALPNNQVLTPVTTGVAPNKSGTAYEQQYMVLPQPNIQNGVQFRALSDERLKHRIEAARNEQQDIAIRALAAARSCESPRDNGDVGRRALAAARALEKRL